MPEREFPILAAERGGLRSIPWAMIAPHDDQATKNHDGQSLARLAQRGGLCYAEAIAILEDREWGPFKGPDPLPETTLAKMVDEWRKRNA